MNGRLKLIEQQLLGIDSAAFQNLCDIYLALREQELASINRTGSQFGKQKTTKGTPDTFFHKIKEDIDKCLDPTKTSVPANQVYKIIISASAGVPSLHRQAKPSAAAASPTCGPHIAQ